MATVSVNVPVDAPAAWSVTAARTDVGAIAAPIRTPEDNLDRDAVQDVILVLVAVCGTCVVLARDPLRQAIMASVYGLVLGILFLAFQAPDVALSQTVVGAVALPLMILLALARVRWEEERRK